MKLTDIVTLVFVNANTKWMDEVSKKFPYEDCEFHVALVSGYSYGGVPVLPAVYDNAKGKFNVDSSYGFGKEVDNYLEKLNLETLKPYSAHLAPIKKNGFDRVIFSFFPQNNGNLSSKDVIYTASEEVFEKIVNVNLESGELPIEKLIFSRFPVNNISEQDNVQQMYNAYKHVNVRRLGKY